MTRQLKLATGVGLAETPSSGRHVHRRHCTTVAGGDPEGQWLRVELGAVLPVGTPVVAHGQPPCRRRLHIHRFQVAGAPHIRDEHQVEVGVAGESEPNVTRLDTRHPRWYSKHALA